MLSFKFKALILFSVTGLFMILMLPPLVERKIPVENCLVCHPLKESAETWKVSSHSQIACVKCHGATKVSQFPLHSIEIIQNTWIHSQGKKYEPTLHRNLENEVCEQCHTPNRRITPSGDLIVPHDKHKAKNVPCVRCHQTVGHGETVQLNMTECMQCHEKRKVSHDCTVCHSNIQVPDTHIDKNWQTFHGLLAFDNPKDCARCHAYFDVINEAKGTSFQIASIYAKGNPYCLDCHNKKPPFHETGWLPSHPFLAGTKGMKNCLACHFISDLNKKAFSNKVKVNVNNMDCNKCHLLDPETGGEASCQKCHSDKSQ